jgi:hypothetical protein
MNKQELEQLLKQINRFRFHLENKSQIQLHSQMTIEKMLALIRGEISEAPNYGENIDKIST